MDFLRSLKLAIAFVLLFFSGVLGMERELPTVDSVGAIKSQLAKYLVRVEKGNAESTDGRLVHEGISTVIGARSLLAMFSTPANFHELQDRQEILRELVTLKTQDFESLHVLLKKLATLFKEYSVLGNQIEQLETHLKKMEEGLWTPDLDARMAFTAFIALPILYSMWGSLSGTQFSAYVGLSTLFSALDQYFLNGAVSSYSPLGYIFSGVVGKLCKGKDTLLATGNSVFAMDDHHIASLLVPNACAQPDLLTCAGESCYCVGADGVKAFITGGSQSAGLGFSAYVPSVVKSAASCVSQVNSALVVGSSLLHLTLLNKRIAYKKMQSILATKKKKMRELLNQFTVLLNDLNVSIKQKNLKLSTIEICDQAEFGVKLRYFATLDVLIGLASLMREANPQEKGSVKFKFGFVDFVESDQNTNRFEISIKNICHFFKFKPEDEYKTATVFANDYIFPELSFVVSEDNKLFANSKEFGQINFLTNLLNPIYAQMLLAHTFGIVWGESARMKFIDMSRLSFISNQDKAVFQVIFPC
ncbi:MAG: hypothetical protein WCS92_04525 [Candidatus Babeliales bacterium]|jgi:hypothetical protein|nr:MAG: hypothetical protein US22_C0018G0003 [candidate division TM6 bacterium GW2011_GWF2_36_6]